MILQNFEANISKRKQKKKKRQSLIPWLGIDNPVNSSLRIHDVNNDDNVSEGNRMKASAIFKGLFYTTRDI